MSRPVTAQAVSAYLRRNGFLPVPNEPKWQGVKVTRSYGGAYVSVDLDLDGKARRWTDELAELLAVRYVVERSSQSATSLYVIGHRTEDGAR